MIVDTSNRTTLSEDQKDFLQRIIPWGRFVQFQTKVKGEMFQYVKCPTGLLASVFIADCIIQSNWQTHPISSLAKGNNLGMLEITPGWIGKKIKYQNKRYKCFDSFEAYSIHISDMVGFSPKFLPLLQSMKLETQAQEICKIREPLISYNERILNIIDLYKLSEFDQWP